MTVILVHVGKTGDVFELGFAPSCTMLMDFIYPGIVKENIETVQGLKEMIAEVDNKTRTLYRFIHGDGKITFNSTLEKLKEEVGIA